jgi:signal transduction histidine kinase
MEEDQLVKQMQHQRQLTQASIDGQEKERKEIGKELHDNIGQQLTTIKLFLDIAKTTADEPTNDMVSMALKGISDVINDIREMSRSLVPSTLKDLGLVESIEELIESFTRTQKIEINFDDTGFDEDLLQENQKLALFRIIQEQLNNIVKHSAAEHASIRLYNEGGLISLAISDDGAGFDPEKIRKGLGFMNIRNRAELLDGLSEIVSSPGKGCILKVVLPVTPIS